MALLPDYLKETLDALLARGQSPQDVLRYFRNSFERITGKAAEESGFFLAVRSYLLPAAQLAQEGPLHERPVGQELARAQEAAAAPAAGLGLGGQKGPEEQRH